MRFPALSRAYLSCGEAVSNRFHKVYAARVFFLIFGFLLLSLFTPLKANAQVDSLADFARPNVDAGVATNQHTLVQSVTIEVFSALICQLAGIDVLNPDQGCLNLNPVTNKLGYVKSDHAGGLLGMGTQMIGGLYTPPASGISYARTIASDFGFVKNTYAQTCIPTCDPPDDTNAQKFNGFDALQPVQKLWVAVRNLTYMLFILVFVLLGIAIMLRYKIDGHGHGQTVMNIQNQLPKVVVALIMITFSYAIVGLLVDFMWATTYFGINVLTSAENPQTRDCGAAADDEKYALRQQAHRNILNNPVAYMNDIFYNSVCIPGDEDKGEIKIASSGIASLAWTVGRSMGNIVDNIIRALINPDNAGCGLRNVSGCIDHALGVVLDFFISILGILIAICALLFALFKLWWELLKAYAYVIVYTVISPIFILLGLIPGGHNGFGPWLRKIIANLAVFPTAAFMIIAARIILDLYSTAESSNNLVTPLIGNPNIGVVGPLLAFGLLMLAPELVNLVRNALGAPPGQIGGIVQSNFAAGIGPGMYPFRQPWNRMMARGGHGVDAGWLREKIVGTGTPNKPQRVMRTLGVAKPMKASDYHAPDLRSTAES